LKHCIVLLLDLASSCQIMQGLMCENDNQHKRQKGNRKIPGKAEIAEREEIGCGMTDKKGKRMNFVQAPRLTRDAIKHNCYYCGVEFHSQFQQDKKPWCGLCKRKEKSK